MISPTPYQLLPRLTDEEYDALRADIAENGVRVPIDVDEDGVILDGHHRAWITADLNIDCPKRVLTGLSEEQKRTHAVAVNVHRRSLSREQRRELVARLRASGMSTPRIAQAVATNQSTVVRDLQAMQVHTLPDRVIGADGKSYSASRPSPRTDPTNDDLFAGGDWLQADPEHHIPGQSTVLDHAELEIVTPFAELRPAQDPQPGNDARLDAELDAEMEGTNVRFRRNFTNAMAKADDLWQFDVDRIAELYAATYDTDIRPWLNEMTRWCDRVQRACTQRRNGLRLVQGE